MFQKNKIIILIVALLGAAGAFFYRPQQTYAAGFSGMTFYHRFLINCWGDSMTAGQGGNRCDLSAGFKRTDRISGQ